MLTLSGNLTAVRGLTNSWDNFICQKKVEEITMAPAVLDLILTSKEECVEEVTLGEKLPCYT